MKRIWIPEAPFIHRRRMIEGELFAPKARIQGIITLGLVHVRTGLIARSLTFKNLITDAGLDGIGTKTIAAMTNFCGVGTGNSSPAVGQTSLDEQVVRSNNAGGFTEGRGVAGDLSYTWWKRTRIFTTSQANATLTEVGFFESSSGGVMFARQLIKDELGNPTTITKTPEYELRVTYEVRWYVPPDTEYSALIDGVSQTIRTRAAIVQNWGGVVPTNWAPDGGVGNLQYGSVYQGSLGPVTGVPPGAAVLSDPAWEVLDPYVGGSFERTANFRIASAVGNGTYYKTIVFARNGNMAFQHEILTGPGIIKNNTQRFDIYGQVSWTRYTP